MSLLSNSNYMYITKTLLGRATSIASNNDIDLMKYLFCDNYSTSVKRKFCEQYKIKCGQNGFGIFVFICMFSIFTYILQFGGK